MSAKAHKFGNFSVKLQHGKKKRSVEEENAILVKKFLRKFKKSGIVRELKKKQSPMTRGQKERLKKFLGKKRGNKKNAKKS